MCDLCSVRIPIRESYEYGVLVVLPVQVGINLAGHAFTKSWLNVAVLIHPPSSVYQTPLALSNPPCSFSGVTTCAIMMQDGELHIRMRGGLSSAHFHPLSYNESNPGGNIIVLPYHIRRSTKTRVRIGMHV